MILHLGILTAGIYNGGAFMFLMNLFMSLIPLVPFGGVFFPGEFDDWDL